MALWKGNSVIDQTRIDVETGEIVLRNPLDQQLAEATTPAETRKVIFEIDMLLKVAKAVGETTEQVNELQMTRIEAICQAGEMLAELERGKPGRPTKKGREARALFSDYQRAREEGQISERLAQFWQKVAAIQQELRQAYYDECIAIGSEISLTGLLIFVKQPGVGYDGDEWYTPSDYIEAARKLMGAIDCDPASCELAQRVVKAKTFYTVQTDGLKQDWTGRVWLNPPYSQPKISQFTERLIEQYEAAITTEAVLLVNNCTDAGWFIALARRYPMMFSIGRAQFWQADQKTFATRQGQAVFYLGTRIDRFLECFNELAYAPNVLDS